MAEIITVGENLTINLCDEGLRLRRNWEELIGIGANPEEIYAAMKAYFFHKNGKNNLSNFRQAGYCPECCFVGGK